MTRETIDRNALISEIGLTVESEFVPFSKSRNAKEKQPSFNWRVTVKRDGRQVLTTDYMAGSGHCPAYKASVKLMGNLDSVMRGQAVRAECETGRSSAGKPISPPAILDVLSALIMDSDVLNAAGFEDWASNYGFDLDSRKAEALYRACLEIALKLRSALGEANLAKLREAFQDY